MEGIVDFDERQANAEQIESQRKEVNSLKSTLDLVDHFHPGMIEALVDLVKVQAEQTFAKFPNADTEWRKGFPCAPRQVFKSPVFNSWVKKIGTEERVKVTTTLMEEHFDLTEMDDFDSSVSNREKLAYMTQHGWD
jgi:hypothetical protein